MHNFHVVCVLAVSYYLVVCVYANSEVSEAVATAAVADAEGTVKTLCARAQKELDDAQSVLQKVESSKSKAEQAESKSKAIAIGITDAVAIATAIKSLSDAVATDYPEAQRKLDNIVKTLTPLVSEAQKLEGKTKIDILPNEGSSTDYTGTNKKATDLKGQATDLDGKITSEVQEMNNLCSTANDMEKKAKEAQLKESEVSAIVAVAKIGSMLEKAEDIIGQIEERKNEVNRVVEEMKRLKTNPPVVPDANIEALHKSATDALTAAKGAVENANNAKAEIQREIELANSALTNVKAEKNDVTKAQEEANTAEACVTAAEKIVPKFQNELEIAKDSLTNANDLKQKLKTALPTTTTAPSTKEVKETEKSDLPVGNGTEPDPKDTTIQPKVSDAEQLPRKDSLSQIDNSNEKLKDALRKGAQNMSTTALTGGKAAAPGANNDNAMTLFVPLLVALIVSALLQ